MAPPDALYKYVSIEEAKQILCDASLRWVSPALYDDPWFIGYDVDLGFDHQAVNKAMLNTAVSMIFARDIPTGNCDHPLYKAIVRWRGEERFNNETEAWDALSELLAPTPDTLDQRLKKLVQAWQETVSNSRMVTFSDTPKVLQSWHHAADNFRGLVLRFEPTGRFESAQPVEYTNQRQHLTTIREQVHDLVGIQKASVEESFQAKLLSNSKQFAYEKEWRCIQLFNEEDLDCGEDVEDWYMDESFPAETLKAVYFGFMMPDHQVQDIAGLLQTSYPQTTLYKARKIDEQFEVEFDRFTYEPAASTDEAIGA